jgi:hypothetical protein
VEAYTFLISQTPLAPVEVGFCDTPSFAWGIELSGSLAYLGNGYAGVRVIDVSSPTVPSEVGYYVTPTYAYAAAPSGTTIYTACSSGGPQVYEQTGVGISVQEERKVRKSVMRLLANPVRGDQIELEVGLAWSQKAELAVYNTAGQLVRSVDLSADVHTVRIDARGLSTGIYLIRLRIRGSYYLRSVIFFVSVSSPASSLQK